MNDSLHDLIEIVIGVLVCIAVIYIVTVRATMKEFVDDCAEQHTKAECRQIWEQGNE